MSEPAQTFDTIGVIVGRDLVGDALIKLPFLRALRNAYPKAKISWITSQGPTAFSGPLRESTVNLIDTIYELPPWLETYSQQDASFGLGGVTLLREIIQRQAHDKDGYDKGPFFDLLIDTRNRWRDTIYARKIPHKVFISPAIHFLFSERRPPFLGSRPAHLSDRLLELVQLAAGYVPQSTGSLPVTESMLQKARRILPEGKTYVGLAPGAGWLDKAWPRFKFEKVALMQVEKGRIPVFVLGPQELSWYDELSSTVASAKFPLQESEIWGTNSITIEQTLAIGHLLDVVVANDSGVGHMLAAADCKLISLFGPTSAEKLAPRVTEGIVLRAQDFGSSQTRAITWEAVNDAIEKILAKKS